MEQSAYRAGRIDATLVLLSLLILKKKPKNERHIQPTAHGGRVTYSDPDFVHRVLVSGTNELLRSSANAGAADVTS